MAPTVPIPWCHQCLTGPSGLIPPWGRCLLTQPPFPPLNAPDTHQPRVLLPPCAHPAPFGLGQLVPVGWGAGARGRARPGRGDPDPAAVSLPAGSACSRLRNKSDTSVKRSRCRMPWAGGAPPAAPAHPNPLQSSSQEPQTHPKPSLGPAAVTGPAHLGGTSGAMLGVTLGGKCRRPSQVPPKWRGPRELGFKVSPEWLIPSTSYRRSLDLVSSWCEAVITLISSGIAFPPRANFVSTVTSPRGVRALGARRRQEPNQTPRNRPETGGRPQIPTPQGLSRPRSPPAEVPEGPWCFPPSQGDHLPPAASTRLWGRDSRGERDRRLMVPKGRGGFSSRQSPGWFLAAGICCNPISP